MYAHEELEPDHTSSPTDTMIQDLQLYGYRPAAGEADPRITPEDHVIQTAVADIFDALISTMADTSLDFDLDEILWSTVNTFHRAAERIETKLDDPWRVVLQHPDREFLAWIISERAHRDHT